MSRQSNGICNVCGSDDVKKLFSNKDYTVSNELFDILTCNNCAFTWTHNPPNSEEIGKYYISEDYISHSDVKESFRDRIYHFARWFMLNRKCKLVDKYSKSKQGLMIDIGCGTGYFLNAMQQRGWETLGFEPSADARRVAKMNFNIDVLPSNELPNFTKKVDVVTMWHVLEHIHDLSGYLNKIKDMLNESGLFVVAVPNISSYDANLYKSEWAAIDAPRHLWHFNTGSISQLLDKHGFYIEEYYRMPLDAFYVSMLSQKNVSHKINWFKVLKDGIIGLMKSITNKDASSSLIYLIRKKGTV